MSDYIVNKLINKFKIHNFNTIFIFGQDNNISLLKKFNRYVYGGSYLHNFSTIKFYHYVFNKMRKCIYGFQKLALVWKVKHAKVSSTDYDFILNPLSNFPENQKVNIYHEGAVYTFRLTDIINIWITALCKNNSLIPMPEMPKNPYTNIGFKKSHLLKFYIHIRYHTKFMVPRLIQDFIQCEMDLSIFKEKAYPELVEKGISNHLENETDELLYYDCVRMVSRYKRSLNNRELSTDITNEKKKEVVSKLKPMLKKYLFSTYSCNPRVRAKNKINLINELRSVFKENHLLGRRIFIPSRRRDISMNIVSNQNNSSNSLPDLSETETETETDPETDEDASDSELHSTNSHSEEELFDNEPVFFYSTFVSRSELGLDDSEDDRMNQVD